MRRRASDGFTPREREGHGGKQFRLRNWSFPSFRWSCLIMLIISSAAYADKLDQFQDGDAKRGWRVFQAKGCMSCHKIGEPSEESIGPDLTKVASALNAAELAASMWNHAPQMWERISEHAIVHHPMDEQEVTDLFSFIFFLRYIEGEGDPERGKAVLTAKSCNVCHSLNGKGGGVAADISGWSQYINPLAWLQKMWQHAPQMSGEMQRRGIAWPTFKGREMVDIIAYVRSLGSKTEASYLKVGNIVNGKALLKDKGCTGCHRGGGPGPDFERTYVTPPTIGQLAGSMWNHAPQMVKLMKIQGLKQPALSPKELADIVAYLFSVRFMAASGNAERGEKVFANNGCVNCHTVAGDSEGKKTLAKKVSVTKMAQGLWNHGPKMLETMKQQGINWPNLSGQDMLDLIAFLKKGEDK